MNVKIKKKIYSFLIFVMISVFSLARVLRNGFFHASVGKGGIWNYISLVFLSLFLVFLFRDFLKGKTKKVYLLFFFYALYFIIAGLNNNNNENIVVIYTTFMYPFFLYTFVVSQNMKIKLEIIAFLYTITFYVITTINLVSFIFYGTGKLYFVMVSNVYYSLCLFPFVLINNRRFKSRIIRFLPSLFLFTTLVYSYKRTGIFGFLISLFIYLFLESRGSFFKKFVKILLVLFFVGSMIGILKNNLEYKYARRFDIAQMKKDKGSGRLEIYKILLLDFKNSSFEKKLFGIEKKRIEDLTTHDYAHNDFIEILYTRGIIGLMLFLLVYLYFTKEFFKMYQKEYKYLPEYGFLLTINIFLSMLSVYFIDYGYSIIGASTTGYLIMDFKRRNN